MIADARHRPPSQRFLLCRLFEPRSFGRPHLCTRNVIDDIALQIVGPQQLIAQQLASGAQSLLSSFSELELPVSTKSKYMTSDLALNESLQPL